MLQYFTISGLFWAGALLLYFLFLQKRTFHTLNRMYLLFTLLLGSLIPFLEFPIASTPVIFGDLLQPIVIQLNGAAIIENQLQQQPEAVSTYTQWLLLLFVYASGVLFFIGKTLLGIFKIQQLIQKSKKQKNNTYVLLQNETSHSPFSFFNMIFIGQKDSENTAILHHELAHVKGKHSWDVILIQIIRAVHWFNPLLWIYERIIKQTHEYIADDYALQHTRKKDYSYMLLGQASPIFHVPIISTFHSFTKKRITMIFRKKSKVYSYVMYPIAVLMMFQLSTFLLVSCQEPVDNITKPQEAEDNIEYLTQIDTIVSFDPTSFVESIETVKREVEIHSIVESKPILKSCANVGDNESKATCSEMELLQIIMQNIEYPKGQKVDGIVYLKFLVDEGGDLSSPEIIQSLNSAYDKEVLRVFSLIQDSTEWISATIGRKAVGYYYILPIRFQFE